MPKTFENPEVRDPSEANVLAMIEAARAEIMATGSFDEEPSILNGISSRYRAHEITAEEAEEEVKGLLESRQEH